MKSKDSYNIRVFLTWSNESLPQRWSLITDVLQECSLSVINLKTLFMRRYISFIKLEQRSKKWQIVWISKLQLQIGLSKFRKASLNFLSHGWLKPVGSVVRWLIPLVLKQLLVLLGDGLINFRKRFLKIHKLFEFWMDLSILFHSIIAEEKKKSFLKNCV